LVNTTSKFGKVLTASCLAFWVEPPFGISLIDAHRRRLEETIMPIRNSLLALTVSAVLHGALIGCLWLFPGRSCRPAAMIAPSFYLPGESTSDAITFLVSGTTAIMELPSSPSKPASPITPDKGVAEVPVPNQAKEKGPDQEKAGVRPPASPSAVAGGAQGGGSERAGTTTFFQIPARGLSIVYLIDGSASMGPNGALARARRELLVSLQQLPATARFQIIIYNRSANPLLPRFQHWLTPDPATLELVRQKLAEVHAEGGTDHSQALYRGLAEQPDVLYFLTDAADLPAHLVQEVARRNHERTAIHVIELNDGSPSRSVQQLQQLARANRGTYLAVDLSITP
jgi:hypothetical protein